MSQVHFERNTQTGNTKTPKAKKCFHLSEPGKAIPFREETKSHKQS